jgi:hypothetical protein
VTSLPGDVTVTATPGRLGQTHATVQHGAACCPYRQAQAAFKPTDLTQ